MDFLIIMAFWLNVAFRKLKGLSADGKERT